LLFFGLFPLPPLPLEIFLPTPLMVGIGRLGLILSYIKDLKMVSAASLALTLSNLRVAQRKKKQSADYTSAKVKLIQS